MLSLVMNRIAVLGCAAGLGVATAAGAHAQIDRAAAAAYFAEAEALGRAAGDLWGGGLHGPLLFVDRSTRDVIANTADTTGALVEGDGLYTGTWPDALAIYNGAVEFGGRTWTMLAWPLPAGRYERGRLLAHEMFHRLQAERGWPARNPGNAHLDTEAGRTWLRLEWRALQDALAHTGAARRAAIEDALLFRTHRHALFPDGATEERTLEMNEGLAEYTGMRAALPENARAGWVVRHLDNYDATASRTSIVRNFAYASGAAYGVLLDAVSEAWRDSVHDVGDFGSLLADAYAIASAPADAASARERATRYGGEQLFAEEAEREATRRAQQSEFRARFVTGPTFTLPASPEVRYSFDPNAVVPFDDGGTVYLTASVRDEWGTLTVDAGGALIVTEGGRVARILVPAPEDNDARPLHGPGWHLELADGWEVVPADAGSVTLRRAN